MTPAQEPPMINEFVGVVLLAGFVIVAVFAVVRTIKCVYQQQRLHQSRSNKRFIAAYKAGYRAAHPQCSRATVEAVLTTLPPSVVRRPNPADAGVTPTSPASAGTTRRATVETALTTSTLPVVRRPTPADVGRVPPDVLTSAGPTGRGRHAR